MIKVIKNGLPFFLLTLIIFIFHSRLFFPLSIYTTPDYGRSDSWHFSVANKYYFWEELKNMRLPIWNPQIGTGFPTLAEGQSGIFFLPNLLFLSIFNFALAYNLTIIFSFVTAAWGTYLFCRSLKLQKIPSFFAAITFSAGGFFMLHVQHNNLLQTASMMPWLFWVTNEFIKTRKVLFLCLLSIFTAEQLLAGFPQLSLYSLIFLFVFASLKLKISKTQLAKTFTALFIFVALGFSLAAIQLLPSYELFQNTNNANQSRVDPNQFLYKPINLMQFINPFILGTPKNDSYPHWEPGKWGIFWENTAYIGFVPLILSLGIILSIPFKKNLRLEILILTFIFALSLGFSLGKFSPTHPLFSFPPLSTFRVPSRFLIITSFSLVVISAFFVQKLYVKYKKIAIFFVVVSVLDLFWNFYSYNPTGKASEWLKAPETSSFLKNENYSRIYTQGQFEQWNNNLFNNGWPNNYFYFSREGLGQNSNLIFNINQFSAFESLPTKRKSLIDGAIQANIVTKGHFATILPQATNFLSESGVTHIITTRELTNTNYKKELEVENQNNKFFLYKNQADAERLFITDKVIPVKSLKDIAENSREKFEDKVALVENMPQKNLKLENSDIKILTQTPTQINITANVKGSGVLVLADSYYPGWNAYVDGQKTQVYPTNINSRGILIYDGKHQVIYKFESTSFKMGAYISVISTIGVLLVLYLAKNKKLK